MNDREFFNKLEIALKHYCQTKNISELEKVNLDSFINWLYNQYGMIRKGTGNGKLDTF